MTRSVIIYIMLMISVAVFSQKTKKVTATYTYYAPENVSLEEAKRTALERAKINAIADAFGTLITQSNSTLVTNKNGQSDNYFFSIGGSEVKGEWIETTKNPSYDVKYENSMFVVSVEVCGIIREISRATIDIRTKILCNGTDEKYESSEFRNGDDMYLLFKSPINGYLLAYMYDEVTDQVVRILPYIKSTSSSVPVERDKEYLFFKKNSNTDYLVDEYTMTANQTVEFNTLYIIFSPTNIVRANDFSNDEKDGIRVLKYENFKKWLVGIRKHTSANVTEHTIIVKQ